MKKIIEYTKYWLKVIEEGKEISGHDFNKGFPEYKMNWKYKDALLFALNLISKYHSVNVDESYYEFLNSETLENYPFRTIDKDMWWNLLNTLKIIKEQIELQK
jgi:hypothetical protein